MKVVVSLLWLAISLAFLALGRAHWIEAESTMPVFELTASAYEVSGSGFQVKIDVGGTPLEQPFRKFAEDFNDYLAEQNRLASAGNRRAAWSFFLASAVAIVSLLLELGGAAWRPHRETTGS